MSQLQPSKKDVAEMLLQTSYSIFLHLDPRKDQVVVPPQFRRQPHLILEVGLNMAVPIPDLRVDDEGISCTLSFGRSPFWCRLPWAALFAIVSQEQRGMVWPQDVPAEISFKFVRPGAQPEPVGAGLTPPVKRERPKLVAVESPPEDTPSEEPCIDHEPSTVPAADAVPMAVTEGVPDPDDQSVSEPPVVEEPAEEKSDEPKPKRKLPSYLKVVK